VCVCWEAAARFTEALNQGEAAGLIAEMGLNPTGLGVEPFLRSLQAATNASSSATGGTAMDVEGTPAPAPDAPDKMDES